MTPDMLSGLIKNARANFVGRDIITHITNVKFELRTGSSFKNIPSFLKDDKVLKNTSDIIADIRNVSYNSELFLSQGNVLRKNNLSDEINKRIILKIIHDLISESYPDKNLKDKLKKYIDEFECQIKDHLKDGFTGNTYFSYDDQLVKISNIKEFIEKNPKINSIEEFLQSENTNAQSYVPDFDIFTVNSSSEDNIMTVIYNHLFNSIENLNNYYNYGRLEGAKFTESHNLLGNTKITEPKSSGVMVHHSVIQNDSDIKYSFKSNKENNEDFDSHYAVIKYSLNNHLVSFFAYSLLQLFNFSGFEKKTDDRNQFLQILFNKIDHIPLFSTVETIDTFKPEIIENTFTELQSSVKKLQNCIDCYTDEINNCSSEKDLYIKDGNIIEERNKKLESSKLFSDLQTVDSLLNNFSEFVLIINKLKENGIENIIDWLEKDEMNKALFDSCKYLLTNLDSYKSAQGAHFLVCKDGSAFCLAAQSNLAYHAGVSYFGHDKFLNEKILGIEIESLGDDSYPSPVLQRCIVSDLSDLICNNSEMGIHKNWLITHQQTSLLSRKLDPNLRTYLFGFDEQKEAIGTDEQHKILLATKQMWDNLGINSNTFINNDNEVFSLKLDSETNIIRENLAVAVDFSNMNDHKSCKIYKDISVPYELAYVILSNYQSSFSYQDFCDVMDGKESKKTIFCDNTSSAVPINKNVFMNAISNNIVTFNKVIATLCDINVSSYVNEKVQCVIEDDSYIVRVGTILLAINNMHHLMNYRDNHLKKISDFNDFEKEDYLKRLEKLQSDCASSIHESLNITSDYLDYSLTNLLDNCFDSPLINHLDIKNNDLDKTTVLT